jgi:hypothetical protein
MSTVSKYIEDLVAEQPRAGEIQDPNVKNEIRVAVYGPSGIVNWVRTGPNHQGSTAGVVVWSEQLKTAIIPPRHQDIQDDGLPAHGFYREACKIKNTMEFYEISKGIDNARQQHRLNPNSGAPPKIRNLSNADIYPPWIIDRRNRHTNGRREVDGQRLLAQIKAVSRVNGKVQIDLEAEE